MLYFLLSSEKQGAPTIWKNRSFFCISTRDRSNAFSQHQCIVRESLCLSERQMETFQHNSGAKWREEFHFTYVSSHPKWHTGIPNKACDLSNGGKLYHAESVSDPICERCFLRTPKDRGCTAFSKITICTLRGCEEAQKQALVDIILLKTNRSFSALGFWS